MTHFQEVLSSPKPSRPVWGPPSLLFGRYWSSFPGGKSAKGARLTADLHLFPRLRISGAIHLVPTYAFMAWMGNFTFFTLFVTLKIISKRFFFFILRLIFSLFSFIFFISFYFRLSSFLSFICFLTFFPLPFWSTHGFLCTCDCFTVAGNNKVLYEWHQVYIGEVPLVEQCGCITPSASHWESQARHTRNLGARMSQVRK